jgi:hypothetical protein
MYYDLFKKPVRVRHPQFAGDDENCIVAEEGIEILQDKGGTPFNCMIASDWP